jgi:hypothetical protein
MKKARLIAGVTAAVPVAVGGFAAPAAANVAQPTTAKAHQAPVTGKTVLNLNCIFGCAGHGPGWYSVSVPETLHLRSGVSIKDYSGSVYVTCYYTGDTEFKDPYWDHFTKYTARNTIHPVISATGHIADQGVDMSGRVPPHNSIPHC